MLLRLILIVSLMAPAVSVVLRHQIGSASDFILK
jgi:hypothetical protein